MIVRRGLGIFYKRAPHRCAPPNATTTPIPVPTPISTATPTGTTSPSVAGTPPRPPPGSVSVFQINCAENCAKMAAAPTYSFGVLLARQSFCCFFILLPLCSVSDVLDVSYPIQTNVTYSRQISNFSNTVEPLDFYGLASRDRHGALQLASSPGNSSTAGDIKTGVVILNRTFYLDNSYGISRDFTTTFDMSISRNQSLSSTAVSSDRNGGISFVVYDYEQQLLLDQHPKFKHTELSSNCHSCDGIMAIQFDVYNDWVSILTPSRYGNTTEAITSDQSKGIGLSHPDGTVVKHTVWIDTIQSCNDFGYVDRSIQVFIAAQGSLKPNWPILSIPIWRQVGNVSFGFTASTGNDVAVLYTVSSWNLSLMTTQCHLFYKPLDNPHSTVPRSAVISVSVCGAVLLILVVTMGIYVWKKKRETDFLGEALRSLPGMPREFKYAELKKATDNFSDRNKLGQGGFGEVYKGKLPKQDKVIAIKKFLRETDQGGFLAELTIINRLRHRNLVRLLGWSHRNKKLLLVYDYMPNGSLDKHLFNQQDGVKLSWKCRYNILAGVASALHYLHNEYNQKVVHRDLKASNIMLDADFDACLGDFGLARAIDNGRTSYAEGTGIPGTWGYIAPECLLTGKATRESDVYGFGAVVLEVVCGRRPGTQIDNFRVLVDWVWALHREARALEAVDPRLNHEYEEEDAQRLLSLGMACSHPLRDARPKAHEILQIMQKSLPPPDVPLVKPPFMMDTMSFDGDYPLTSDSTGVSEVPTRVEDPLFSSNDRSCGTGL